MAELLVSLYPLPKDNHPESLSPQQSSYFNNALKFLRLRIEADAISSSLLDLQYDGINQPLPYPDAHWDLVTIWQIIDGTTPGIIRLRDGSSIDYPAILLRDPDRRSYWKRKVDYAARGYRTR